MAAWSVLSPFWLGSLGPAICSFAPFNATAFFSHYSNTLLCIASPLS